MHVRIDNIGFEYPRLPVLNNISFDVPRGDFLSIIGPNGSGKSTLLRLMARILLPGHGRILLEDRPLSSYSRKDLARLVGYVPQETHWLFPFTVMEVVLMGRSPYIGRLGFESREDIDLCRDIMKRTDIEGLAGKPITAISGGERQRVLIARALAQQPSLLLLDEPNAHLDLSHQAGIFEILADYRREHRVTVVWVSHDLNLAALFSDRVLVLAQALETGSHIAAIGTPAEVLTGETIKRVFDASVSVDRHPETGRPRIFLDPVFSNSRNQ
ncbi:MAG: ABC transporter ATP-binding protein [Bacteroidota bacterium]